MRAAISDMSRGGFEHQLVPAFKQAICDTMVGRFVKEWPRTLAPNQHAMMAYTTDDPNYKLRITIDYEDGAGYQWRRTDTSQPRRAEEKRNWAAHRARRRNRDDDRPDAHEYLRHYAGAAAPPGLLPAREQMALSLGFHIVLACFGVAFPTMVFLMQRRGIVRDDLVALRRWAKVSGVLFAVGAVSGTVLSFEMGLLWPGLMGLLGGGVEFERHDLTASRGKSGAEFAHVGRPQHRTGVGSQPHPDVDKPDMGPKRCRADRRPVGFRDSVQARNRCIPRVTSDDRADLGDGRVSANGYGDRVGSWINPTSMVGGGLAVATCVFPAGVFLSADAARAGITPLADRLRRRTLAVGVLSGAIVFAGLCPVLHDAPTFSHGLLHAGFPLLLVAAIAGGNTLILMYLRSYSAARYLAVAAVAAVVTGWGLGQYPWMLVGRLTIDDAAGATPTLTALLVVVGLAVVFVLPALICLLRLTQAARPACPRIRRSPVRGLGTV